jgi:hypothetical protein
MIGPIFYEVNVLGLNEILSSIPPDKDARRQDRWCQQGTRTKTDFRDIGPRLNLIDCVVVRLQSVVTYIYIVSRT